MARKQLETREWKYGQQEERAAYTTPKKTDISKSHYRNNQR